MSLLAELHPPQGLQQNQRGADATPQPEPPEVGGPWFNEFQKVVQVMQTAARLCPFFAGKLGAVGSIPVHVMFVFNLFGFFKPCALKDCHMTGVQMTPNHVEEKLQATVTLFESFLTFLK